MTWQITPPTTSRPKRKLHQRKSELARSDSKLVSAHLTFLRQFLLFSVRQAFKIPEENKGDNFTFQQISFTSLIAQLPHSVGSGKKCRPLSLV